MIVIRFDISYYDKRYLMSNWCHEHFGEGEWKYPNSIQELEFEYPIGNPLTERWIGAELYGVTFFLFRDAEDAAFFSLRWY